MILSLFGLLSATTAAIADDRADRVRAAVEAFGRNIRGFSKFKCKYTVTHGTAASLDDLKAGRYVVTHVCEHVTVADGPRLLARVAPKKVDGGDGEKGRAEVSPCRPATWLSTGSEGMVHQFGNLVDVWKPDGRWPGGLNPLALGLSEAHLQETPDALVNRPEGCQLTTDDLPAIDGRPTVGVRFVVKIGPSSQTVRMALDPARGHLPCRTVVSETSTGGSRPASSTWEFWLLDAKDCGRGRFFPIRYVFFSHHAGQERGYRLFDLVVTELDPDHTPTREDLSVDLPAGTGLYLHRQPEGASLTLDRNTTIHVDDLPAVISDLESRLPRRLDRPRLRELAGRFWPWAALVGGLGVILLAQLWLVRRRRRQVRLHG
jgi:hypothetical protein